MTDEETKANGDERGEEEKREVTGPWETENGQSSYDKFKTNGQSSCDKFKTNTSYNRERRSKVGATAI